MSARFTCNTCKSAFESGELQRAHMHTDYHGYNLQRKIASLAPVPIKIFETIATKSQDGANDAAKLGEAKKTGSMDSQQIERSFTPGHCFFCKIDSPTMDDNVQHMFKIHGLFIPNQEALENAEGLLSYLFNIISEFHECLYCGKTRETIEGIRSHMVDKGHCRIALDEELDQFYDFEGGSEGGVEDEILKEGKKDIEADKTLYPGEHGFHPDSEHELCLPSGRMLGHRSLSRYYRQNLHSYPTPTERAASRAITAAEAASGDGFMLNHLGRQLAVTSARNEMGITGVGAFEKRALRATEKRALKQEARAKSQYEWQVNKESNHQKHYRPANPGPPNG